MTKIVLILRHKVSGDLKEVKFKKSLRFANRIRKFMKDYDLVQVKGKSSNKLVQYMRNQITKYEKSPKDYKIDRGEMFGVAASETRTGVDHVHKSMKRIPKRLRDKMFGEEDEQ